MVFVLLGLLLLVLKLLHVGPVAAWSWWWVLVPFALAFLWWEIVDPMFNVSQKRAMDDMARRQKERREKFRRSLGLGGTRRGK